MKNRDIKELSLGALGFLAALFGTADGIEKMISDRIDVLPLLAWITILTIGVVFVVRWGGLHLLKTGIIDSSFSFNEDEKAWDQAKGSLVYVGVSGFSVAARFLAWCEAHRDDLPPSIKFYLVNPEDTESLRVIATHRNGHPATHKEISDLANEVRVGVTKLRSCPAIRVIFYRVAPSYIPTWMYLIDEEIMYLGFPASNGTGMNSPAYLCAKREDRYSLFDAYKELLVRLDADEEKRKDKVKMITCRT